jgi:hypothetical protein
MTAEREAEIKVVDAASVPQRTFVIPGRIEVEKKVAEEQRLQMKGMDRVLFSQAMP